MFDWLGDFIGGIGDAIGSTFDFLGEQISNAIWNTMLQWFYETIYNAVADFFTMMAIWVQIFSTLNGFRQQSIYLPCSAGVCLLQAR